MRYLKVLIIFSSVTLAIWITYFYTQKDYQELNLLSGKARLESSSFGITFKEYTDMHNPMLCPKWTPPKLAQKQNYIHFSCFRYISTQSCIEQQKTYEKIYEEGCGM
jgi:hypothetical protein